MEAHRRPERSPRFVADLEQPKPPAGVDGGELRITLINHATVLIQQKRSNFLTDPVWSKRASPLTWIGPRRRRTPGVRFEDLPSIDTVLLSHNHYDHLDLGLAPSGGARSFPIYCSRRGRTVVAIAEHNTDRNRQVSCVWQMDSYRMVIGEAASFVLLWTRQKPYWGMVDGYCTSARPRRCCGDVA
jgi:hypothetical protein